VGSTALIRCVAITGNYAKFGNYMTNGGKIQNAKFSLARPHPLNWGGLHFDYPRTLHYVTVLNLLGLLQHHPMVTLFVKILTPETTSQGWGTQNLTSSSKAKIPTCMPSFIKVYLLTNRQKNRLKNAILLFRTN